jgi:transposase
MIDYQTYCAIHDHHSQRGLNAAQIAEALHLDPRTVATWLAEPRFRPRQASSRASKLDPHKPTIRRWLEAHRYSAQQVFQRLREEEGYSGGISIVKDYVRQVRPPRTPAFLTLSFAPANAPRSTGARGMR